MRRSASEVIRNLELRIAKLERQADQDVDYEYLNDCIKHIGNYLKYENIPQLKDIKLTSLKDVLKEGQRGNAVDPRLLNKANIEINMVLKHGFVNFVRTTFNGMVRDCAIDLQEYINLVGGVVKSPKKPTSPYPTAKEIYDFLNRSNTPTGGTLHGEGLNRKNRKGRYFYFDPANRLRMDHYWDNDSDMSSYTRSYMKPLVKEVKALLMKEFSTLKDAFKKDDIEVTIGEKGHIDIRLKSIFN
jgi:hypothetical protein